MAAVQLALQDLAAFRAQLLVLMECVDNASAERPGPRSPVLDALEAEANLFRIRGQALLTNTLKRVTEHQEREREIASAKQELAAQTSKLRKLGAILNEQESILVEDARIAAAMLPPPAASKSDARVSLDWICQSARKLSYTTHAPPNWYCDPVRILEMDYPLEPRFHYSYPTEEEMKRNLTRIIHLRQQEATAATAAVTTTTTTTAATPALAEEEEEAVEHNAAAAMEEEEQATAKRQKLDEEEAEEEEEDADEFLTY